jgi:hypothetical protein
MRGKIVTKNVRPPIPTTQFDWSAYFDGMEESGPYGWGSTEIAAIKELMMTQGLTADGKCLECGRDPSEARGCGVGGCPIGEDL